MQFLSIEKSNVSCDPGKAEFYNNPYPAYELMRDVGPCFFWEEYGIWCFARHEYVNSILRDRRFGRQIGDVNPLALAAKHVKPFYEFESHSILELEPPVHTRLRRLINRAFVSRKIETLRPQISDLSHKLIDGFDSKSEVNLLSEYAEIIPVHIIAKMLGVPVESSNQLLAWSHAMVAMYQHNRSREIEDAAVRATLEFSSFVIDIVELRRTNPKDDLISHLVGEQNKGEELSDDELVATCVLLLNAGHEATVHAIGNGIKTLLEKAEDPAALMKQHENITNICEELLRIDPPLHKFTRYVLEDLEIGGRSFRKGDVVGLLLGAANHDADKFETPSKLVFDRKGLVAANTAFGAGIHFCVGAPLARLEMQIALPILFERLPRIQLKYQPTYADRYHFHGLEKLVVSW